MLHSHCHKQNAPHHVRVLGADGTEEGQVVVEVEGLATVLQRSSRQWMAVGGRHSTSKNNAANFLNCSSVPSQAAFTSLPMAIQVRFQGSGWPIAARTDPHLLHSRGWGCRVAAFQDDAGRMGPECESARAR